MPGKRRSLEERLISKTVVTDDGDCHWYLGARSDKGYGVISRGGRGEGQIYAHRASWEIHYGAIPDGLIVMHMCDVPYCVNPKHLVLGTHAQNIADRDNKGRQAWGEKHGNHKLTAVEVQEIRMLYGTRLFTYKQLAKEYGVTINNIAQVVHRFTWAMIPKSTEMTYISQRAA
jgi:hypothetical protein